jgi:23S rRNA (cytosine1962-C5)-methyltransferase
MLRRAAWQAGKDVQVFHVAGAGGDHPYFAHVQEGRYLKAVFCRVHERPDGGGMRAPAAQE